MITASGNKIANPSIGQTEYLKYFKNRPANNRPDYILLQEELRDIDVSAMKKAVSYFVSRHESLRTIFPCIDGKIRQMILSAEEKKFGLDYLDISSAKDFVFEMERKYFEVLDVFSNVEAGPLSKSFLFKLNSD